MNDIKIFENPEFGQVHTIIKDGEAWFCAKDVCDILGFGNGRQALASHVDEADVQKLDVRYGGQVRQMSYVNESGLFSLIMGSTLPRAKQFKHWVTSEVLPSIRKYGVYASKEFIANAIRDPQFAIGILNALDQEREKTKQLLIANTEQQKQIEETKPLVTFAQTVDMSETSIPMGQMAKMLKQAGIEIGRNRLSRYCKSGDSSAGEAMTIMCPLNWQWREGCSPSRRPHSSHLTAVRVLEGPHR